MTENGAYVTYEKDGNSKAGYIRQVFGNGNMLVANVDGSGLAMIRTAGITGVGKSITKNGVQTVKLVADRWMPCFSLECK